MTELPESPDYSEDQIKLRMESGIRRALSTPPTPTKELVGKTERAQEQRETKRFKKARQAKSKDA